MLVGCSVDYCYFSTDKWVVVDVFGVKFQDEAVGKHMMKLRLV